MWCHHHMCDASAFNWFLAHFFLSLSKHVNVPYRMGILLSIFVQVGDYLIMYCFEGRKSCRIFFSYLLLIVMHRSSQYFRNISVKKTRFDKRMSTTSTLMFSNIKTFLKKK